MRPARLVYAFVLIGAFLALQAYGADDVRVFSMHFSGASLKSEHFYLDGRDYDVVAMDDLGLSKDLGNPCLPVAVRHIYVPRGKKIAGIKIVTLVQAPIPGDYLVLPGQHEVPYSSDTAPVPVAPDPVVYSMTEPYPASPVVLCRTGSMGGRKLTGLLVYPVQYVPSERKLLINTEINFTVEFTDAAEEPASPRETEAVRKLRNHEVSALVENPADVEADFPPGSGTLDPAAATEYLLLVHENLVDMYGLLQDWKTRKGVPATIVTVQDVYATYPGRDNPERLRNCIKDYYLNHSTVWVTLTMSVPRVEIRGCYGRVGDTVDDGIPCDLYFADMDGDWNSDGDGLWGETTDDVDLYPDVYVGRLPGNTGGQSEPTIEKVLTYEGCYDLPTDYQLDMLFLAEFADAQTNGALAKNLIDTESVPARFDPITKLYESSGNLNHGSAMDALNSGMGLINHDGHGNTDLLSIGPSILTSSDMEALTNAPRYSVFYTVACDPGNFGGVMGCFAKGFLCSVNGGGFFVGNSRYGFYWPGNPGYGTGELYDREFFKSLFVRNETHLGVVHADAKAQRAPYAGYYGTERWTQFTSNLFGDPETPVWKDTPLPLAATHPDSILVGNHLITVDVSSAGSPLAGARVCLWMGDDIYLVDETGAGGAAQFEFAAVDTGDLLVTVTKDAYLPYLGSIRVDGDFSGLAGTGFPGGTSLRVSPNPVTEAAVLDFSLARPVGSSGRSAAVITIYDAAGRLVGRLSASDAAPSGSISWDGRSLDGSPVRPGIYFARLACGDETRTTKFVVLR
jgi:hypothetical protein